ncbi:hypothetical protein HIU97_12050 [Enterococcus casseliflavus]|uniref:hypothetical protein n=1 Tax=Enterococcus casseliflavus TaxID=37734 RepID=UPI001C46E741|nr:hypothetical protein [Enterococcus casseliflavus]MBV6375456.1 hypothetical protein [Enterococcus casseliflavus]
MKYLIIERNKGYFLKNNERVEIDKIDKEDIYNLISELLESSDDEFEMDEFSEETLQHGVHSIIYRNIYNKFVDLKKEKIGIQDSVNQQFYSAFQKYNNE